MRLTRDEYAAWLGRYVSAWKSYDPKDIGELFSDEAAYSYQAGTKVVYGREAIAGSWLADRDPAGSWDAHYEPLAIDEEVHVAIGWTRYFDDAGATRDEYSNIFVCRFDGDRNCTEFTEWWMRPAKDDTGAGAE